MKWKEEFSVGIETIDKQHQRIFEHMLALENSVEKRDPPHVLLFFLQEVADYLRFHFAVEEAVLEIIGYPGLKGHSAGHERLNIAILELEHKIKKKGSASDLVGFFEEWFVRHVLSADRAYATFAIETLRKPPSDLQSEAISLQQPFPTPTPKIV